MEESLRGWRVGECSEVRRRGSKIERKELEGTKKKQEGKRTKD